MKLAPALALGVLASILPHAAAAQVALLDETYVLDGGDDTQDCSMATPCETVNVAVSKTNPGGVLRLLAPIAASGVIIDRSITILGSNDIIRVSGGNPSPALSINAGTAARVVLKGIHIDGFGTSAWGIGVSSAAAVLIEDCVVNASNVGLSVSTGGQTVVMVKNSTFSRNTDAIEVKATGASINRVLLDAVQIFDTQDTALNADGANSSIVLNRTTIAGSLVKDVEVTSGGTVSSYGNNVLRGWGNPTALQSLE